MDGDADVDEVKYQLNVQGGTLVRRRMFAAAAALVCLMMGSAAATADSILINFSSPHCAPCRAMRPVLQALEHSGVPVRHVDVNAEPSLAQRFGIRRTPTFLVLREGKEVTRLVGRKSERDLREALAIRPGGPLVPTRSDLAAAVPPPRTRLNPQLSTRGGPRTQLTAIDSSPPAPASDPPPAAQRRSEAMPSITVADAVERARAATVRLRVHDGQGFGSGTGTIVDTHGEEALVMTCGHLFRDNEGQGKIEVDLFNAGETITVPGTVIDYDSESKDIALVAIRPGFAIAPVRVIGKGERVRNGQTAFSFGCDQGDDPSRRDTRITGVNKYLGSSNLQIDGAPIYGRSGGGLFDAEGTLIGVCNAADFQSDVGIYTGPGSIHWQLDRVNLAHLYQDPSGTLAAAPPAAPAGDRLAGRGDRIPAGFEPEPSAMLDLEGPRPTTDRELIVIVRDRNDPLGQGRMLTLTNPSAELMRMIEQSAPAR